MDKPKSRWTLWRKRRKRVAEHMHYVHSVTSVSQDQGQSSTPPEVVHEMQDDPVVSSDRSATQCSADHDDGPTDCTIYGLNASEGNELLHEVQATSDTSNTTAVVTEECLDEDYYSHSEGSSEDLEERDMSDLDATEEEKDVTLREDLKDWASDSQIPLCKVKELLTILGKYHPTLPLDPRTLLQTTTKYNIQKISGGEYYHFGEAHSVEKLQDLSTIEDGSEIYLQINVDGIPIFKSSREQFWPILGRVVRPIQSAPFVIGIFCGNQKPTDVNEYLERFVTELKEYQDHDLHVTHLNRSFKVCISCFICDAPARAFLKQTKGHNAYYGCEKCTQRGTWLNKVTFPDVDAEPRTDASFDEMAQEEHHNNQSPLTQLGIGLVSQFPLDPMHLVYLGVVKRLIWSWIKAPIASGCRISANLRQQISLSLISCHSYVPKEFPRKCRSFDEFERWKATEFRQFLLYVGAVVLKGKLSDKMYKHFLLLFVAIFCLCSPLHIGPYCEYADELLRIFVLNWADLYGKDTLVSNVHGLVHLAADARRYGPLDSFSAFPFENMLGKLKLMVRKPNKSLAQVIRRMSEMNKTSKKSVRDHSQVDKEHHQGPVILQYKSFSQYENLFMHGFFFSRHDHDNCVQIGSQYGLIRNIIRKPQQSDTCAEPMVVFEPFLGVTDFFEYPLKSSDIGIVKVNQLSGTLKAEKASCIVSKYFRIPYKDSFTLVPLLHQMC